MALILKAVATNCVYQLNTQKYLYPSVNFTEFYCNDFINIEFYSY